MPSQIPPSQERILTFGIEFEFMVAKRIAGRPDPHPNELRYVFPPTIVPNSVGVSAADQAQSYIVGLLKDNQIPSLSEIRFHDVEYTDENSAWGNQEYLHKQMWEQGVIIDPGQIATHAFWVVSEDVGITTIEGLDVAGYEFVAMEVASRILKETQFREVERVYSLIKSNLRTQVNISCGLHIHVGINHLSLESAKKLVTLLMLLEEKNLFRDICAPHRANSGWCKPVSRNSRAYMCGGDQSRDRHNNDLAAHVRQLVGGIDTALRRALTHIWNCTTIEDVAAETRVFGGEHGYNEDDTWHLRGGFAIRYATMGPDIEGNCAFGDTTIEFRYKESTGSATKDRHWLELCLRFVRVAEWPGGYYQALMWNLHQARDLQGCLSSLGVERDEVRWWLGVAQHHRDHPMLPRNTQFLGPE